MSTHVTSWLLIKFNCKLPFVNLQHIMVPLEDLFISDEEVEYWYVTDLHSPIFPTFFTNLQPIMCGRNGYFR